jgi:hypothetical protein
LELFLDNEEDPPDPVTVADVDDESLLEEDELLELEE